MLSILIPTYNYFIKGLTTELHRQASASGRAFEIIVSDDGSEEEFRKKNERVSNMDHVQYVQQNTDLKRSGNRNFLAQTARYEYLLFIDCDAAVPSEEFIEQYLKCCAGKLAVCGGTAYSDTPPEDRQYFLRWFYGWKREVRSAASRNKNPGSAFSAFNFLIERSIFLENPFPQEIKEYGHEDTIFGLVLAEKGYEIRHIDNQLIHTGLETGREFLAKSLKALDNLKVLLTDETHASYIKSIRIARSYIICRKTGLAILLRWLFPLMRPAFERSLLGKKPDMFFFDLYKLGYLLWLDRVKPA